MRNFTSIFITLFFISSNLVAQVVVSQFPYFESFEGDSTLWSGDGHWQLGEPDDFYLNSASSGDNAWVTNLRFNYFDNSYSALESPYFDLSTLTLPYISFQLKTRTESGYDGLRLQYTTNDNFWYNLDQSSSSAAVSRNYSSFWTGNSGTGFVKVLYSLEQLPINQSIKFRFLFVSDGSINDEGVLIDDILISDFGTSRLDVSSLVLNSFSDNCTGTENLSLLIQNNFENTISGSSLRVKYQSGSSNIVTEQINTTSFFGRDYHVHHFNNLPQSAGPVTAWVEFLTSNQDLSNDTVKGYFNKVGLDLRLNAINSPTNLTSCLRPNSESVSIEVENLYTQNIVNIPVKYQLNNGNIVSETINLVRTGCRGFTPTTFSFNNQVDMSALGTQVLKVWIDLPADQNKSNDTLVFTTTNNPPLQLPFTEDFESGLPMNMNNEFSLPPNWESISSTGIAWEVRNEIPNVPLGPKYPYNHTGNFLYLNGTYSSNAAIQSECITIPNDSNSYELSFLYHQEGYIPFTNNNLSILINSGTGVGYRMLNNLNREDAYLKGIVSLDNLKGNSIRLYLFSDFNTTTNNIAIDDIRMYKKSKTDLVLNRINNLNGSSCGVQNDSALNLTILNNGLVAVTQAEICYTVNFGPEVCETIGGGIIDTNQTETYNLAKKLNLEIPGEYKIEAYIKHPADSTPENDTFRTVFYNNAKHIPYIDRVSDSTYTKREWEDNSNNNSFFWKLNSGFTPSTATGPSFDADSSNGFYYYTETENFPLSSLSATLDFKDCFDFRLGNPHFIEYEYHMYGADIDRLYLQAITDTGIVLIDSLIGSQQQQFNDPWKKRSIPNTFFDSAIVSFQFVAIKKNTGDKSDIAIDNFGIRDTTVSLSANNLNNQLTIYPNPTTKIWNIKSSFNFQNNLFQVYNLKGQLIQEGVLKKQNNQIDLSNSPSGIYFLQINELEIREKLIKY